MIFKQFALLASDTARTKAYLQEMRSCGNLPGMCVVFTDDIAKIEREAEAFRDLSRRQVDCEYFNIEEPVLCTIQDMDIPYIIVANKDINSPDMQECITNLDAQYLIYSGYGGYILKPHLFELGKRYVHIHAGILPQYRGSTTFYYSMLQEHMVGATAIFLSPGIDEGAIITQREFLLPPKGVNVDYVYEPYIRARVLMDVFDICSKKETLPIKKQNLESAETYYIIHPLLKHIALLEQERGYGE